MWSHDAVSPTVPDGGAFPRTVNLRSSNWLGGGTIGYNFQSGSFVYGVEGDLGHMHIGKSASDPPNEIDSIKSAFYADLTGRLGVTAGSALFYAKAGWAYYGGKATTNVLTGPFTPTSTGTFNGWTAGGGIEYKLAPAFKGEYLHYDFGSETATLTGGSVFPYKNSLTADTVKLGINYRPW